VGTVRHGGRNKPLFSNEHKKKIGHTGRTNTFHEMELLCTKTLILFRTPFPPPPDCFHLVWGGGGLAGLNDLTGYGGGNFMFLVGPPKPDRT
jgi:hypothetical protein